MGEIWLLSTCLVPNFIVSLRRRYGTTVSLETNLSYKALAFLIRADLGDIGEGRPKN